MRLMLAAVAFVPSTTGSPVVVSAIPVPVPTMVLLLLLLLLWWRVIVA